MDFDTATVFSGAETASFCADDEQPASWIVKRTAKIQDKTGSNLFCRLKFLFLKMDFMILLFPCDISLR